MNDLKIFNKAEDAGFDAGKQFLGIVEAAAQSDEPRTFLFGDRQLRTCVINQNPWFVGKDVADILGYQNGSRDINRHVDDEDRVKEMIFDGTQKKETIIINESGLYSLILKSKLPAAKDFKRWVTSDVIPAIRKSGTYRIPKIKDSYMIPDPIERAKAWIKEEECRQALAAENEKLTIENKEMQPKSEYFDLIVEADNLTSIRDFSKQIGVKESNLVHFLIDQGYVYRTKFDAIRPMAGKGDKLFELKEFVSETGNIYRQTMVTAEGKAAVISAIENSGLCSNIKQNRQSAKERLSLYPSNTIRRRGPKAKPVRCVETNEVFDSVKAAAAKYEIASSCISTALSRKSKSCGLHWEYAS